MRYLVCNEIGSSYFKGLVNKTELLKDEKSHMLLDTSHILNLSTYYYTSGEPQKSLDIIEWGIESYQGDDDLKIEKCKILILQMRYQEAEQVLRQLWHPTSPYALYERTKLAILTQHEDVARKYVEQILTNVESKEEVFTQLTFFFSVNHMVERALECWEAACKNPPKSDDFKLTQVALEYEMEEYDSALKHCQSLYNKWPNNLVVCLYLTAIAISLNKYRKTQHLLSHLKEIHPASLDLLKLEKTYNNSNHRFTI